MDFDIFMYFIQYWCVLAYIHLLVHEGVLRSSEPDFEDFPIFCCSDFRNWVKLGNPPLHMILYTQEYAGNQEQTILQNKISQLARFGGEV